MKYREAVAFLDSLVNYERAVRPRNEFKLDAIRDLLALAGNPQLKINRTLLVAGTKGKGSVCYLVEAGLRACGISTGMFVSPHVRSVRERIQLAGRPASKTMFAAAVGRLAPLVRQRPVSYFEMTAALAFDLFARRRVDWAVVEVGLGGRLDATNLSDPDISVITRIGLDHIEVLGRTVRRIAGEKAGIMRAGRPVVLGEQISEAADALARHADAFGAEPFWVGRQVRTWDHQLDSQGQEISVLGELGGGKVRLNLLGPHQLENCRTALSVLGLIARQDSRVRFDSVVRGLAGARIPARCEIAHRNPLVLVDSCHNPDSGAALERAIAGHIGEPVILVYGSLRGKRVTATVRPLQPWIAKAVLTCPDSPRATRLAELRRAFTRLDILHESRDTVPAAVQRALELSAGKTPVVVAGSFYLAGEALAAVVPEPAD